MIQNRLDNANAHPETAMSGAPLRSGIRSRLVNSLALRLRGYILAGFVLYIVVFLVIEQSDVIATVIAASLGILLFLTLLLTQFHGRKVKSSLEVSLEEAAKEQSNFTFVSNEPSHLIIKTSPVSVMPFFELEAKLRFDNEEPLHGTHVVVGRSRRPRYLREELLFPHRGYWRVRGIDFSLGDQPGLTRFEWDIDMSKNPIVLPVHPPSLNTDSLPIISSTYKSGDRLTLQSEPRGDYFDIKAYHPSDGARRILWKIFAKKGELVSRHPERSMDPEGQTIVFSLAGKHEDEVAGAALSYLKRLEKLDMDVFFGCRGMGNAGETATSSAAALDLILKSVWENSEKCVEEISSVIQAASAATTEKVAIFAGIEGMEDPAQFGKVIETAAHLSSNKIEPVFFMVAKNGVLNRPGDRNGHFAPNPVQNFFFGSRKSGKNAPRKRFNVFLQNCASNGWEVIILE